MIILNLQSMRAIAAIFVVIFHIIGTSSAYGYRPNIISFIEGWGACGVDIFFVISGFVMYYNHLIKSKSATKFIQSRIIRIVPLYWFITFIAVLSVYLLPREIFNNDPPTLSTIFQSLFFLSLIISEKEPIVYVGWTLEYEMCFYIIFSLSIFLQKKINLIFFNFIILIFVSMLFQNLIILEFFLGILIAWISNNSHINKKIGCIFVAIGFLILLLTIGYEFNKDLRFFYWGIPSGLIIIGCIYTYQIKNKTLLFLGNASYSIYLVQMLTIPFYYKIISYFDVKLNYDLHGIFCLLFSILIGAKLYLIIERPIIKFLNLKVRKF